MSLRDFISIELVLLTPEEGGRMQPLTAEAYGGHYRPHMVIESRNNRTARIVVKDGVKTIDDVYLGILFWTGPSQISIGSPFEVSVALMYAEHVAYNAAIPNAEFTLREGDKIVGHGIIKKRWQE